MAIKIPMIQEIGSISPNYYVSPNLPKKIITIKDEKEPYEIDKILNDDLETWIYVYEDRVNGWFLNFAEELTNSKNSEFVVLMICISYLEGNQQFRDGKISPKGKSSKMLKKSLKRIFPKTNDNIINLLIDKVRHGFSHDGMTRSGVLLRYGLSIPFFIFIINNTEWIQLDPSIFLKEVQRDFKDYINILKNKKNKKERYNFEKHYKEIYKTS